MDSLARAALVAMVVGWTIGAHADEGAAKVAVQPPQVQVSFAVAEYSEQDLADIERALGISNGYGEAADDKIVRSLEQRKLLRVLASPTIATPSGSAAVVSYDAGQGRDRGGNIKPTRHEIEIQPKIVPGKKPMIVAEIRYRETTGESAQRCMFEVDTGLKFKAGETIFIRGTPLGPAAAKDGQGAKGVGKLLIVKAAIVEPKPALSGSFPNPRIGQRKLRPNQ